MPLIQFASSWPERSTVTTHHLSSNWIVGQSYFVKSFDFSTMFTFNTLHLLSNVHRQRTYVIHMCFHCIFKHVLEQHLLQHHLNGEMSFLVPMIITVKIVAISLNNIKTVSMYSSYFSLLHWFTCRHRRFSYRKTWTLHFLPRYHFKQIEKFTWHLLNGFKFLYVYTHEHPRVREDFDIENCNKNLPIKLFGPNCHKILRTLELALKWPPAKWVISRWAWI